mgnify:CR=1 FL=1
MTSGTKAIEALFNLDRDDLADQCFNDEVAKVVVTFLAALAGFCS